MLGKKTKSVLGSQINLEILSCHFFEFRFRFSQVLPEVTIHKNSNFIQFSPFPPLIMEKLNQI